MKRFLYIVVYSKKYKLFITVDNDNTTKSITLVVIRHALLMVMMATDLDSILSFVVYSWTAD